MMDISTNKNSLITIPYHDRIEKSNLIGNFLLKEMIYIN